MADHPTIPSVLFSLHPISREAQKVVRHPSNKHLFRQLDSGKGVLDIGHVRSVSGNNTLAILGRDSGNVDVEINHNQISKVQCSFEIHKNSKVVMFYDRTMNRSCQVFGERVIPFESHRQRKVALYGDINSIIGMGGEWQDLIRFKIEWHAEPKNVMEINTLREPLIQKPHLADTADPPAVAATPWRIRIHTAGPQQPQMRYKRLENLGSGQFGTVHKALDMDSGDLMAVKYVKQPTGPASLMAWQKLKREVEILSRISHEHDHIVDYITSQGWGSPEAEIFMGLKEGTLESLMLRNQFSMPIRDLFKMVFHHMLQAIDFLASKKIIHRDVKPANILYISHKGQYHFQLGDFGLSHTVSLAETQGTGSPLYMAPEMRSGEQQTHKVDVWSLFVTMLWTTNVHDFRRKSEELTSVGEIQGLIDSAGADPFLQGLQPMARTNPEERASAADMLISLYDGQGLVTGRRREVKSK